MRTKLSKLFSTKSFSSLPETENSKILLPTVKHNEFGHRVNI